MTDPLVEAWRKQVGAPAKDVPLDEYLAWMDSQESEAPLVIHGATAKEEEEQIAIEDARLLVLEGVGNEVEGRVKIIKGLLKLKENDLWKRDILVAHIENPRWKDDYLAELIEWMKEQNPNMQAGLSTLMNYMKYYQAFVEGYGFEEELVFGATEFTRRALYRMADWEYGGGLPKRLRNGYDIDKLPQPPSFNGSETDQQRLVAGIREVAKQAFSLGRYSPDLFEAYEHGDGDEKTTISMVLTMDGEGTVSGWTAFIKKVDGEGNPLASYAADILRQEMPCEVLDWLEARGFHVEMDA